MENLIGPRDANGIPVPMTVEESIASMKASLLKNIKRSAYVYRVDCGGCNGCSRPQPARGSASRSIQARITMSSQAPSSPPRSGRRPPPGRCRRSSRGF